MTTLKARSLKKQAGLTLIELAVVLLILVGLAGLALPYISGFVGKTHNSTSAASGTELFNDMMLYQSQSGGYPNNLDLLTTDAAGTLPNYLDDAVATGGTTNWAALTDTNGAITQSLINGGINTVALLPAGVYSVDAQGNASNTINATFTPNTPGTTLSVTGGTPSVSGYVTDSCSNGSVTPSINGYGTATCTNIAGALNYQQGLATHNIIVLGISADNSMIGATLAASPVHFPDAQVIQPQVVYSRFLAAFDVDFTCGGTVSAATCAPAKLIGIVHGPDTDDGIEALGSNLQAYYAS